MTERSTTGSAGNEKPEAASVDTTAPETGSEGQAGTEGVETPGGVRFETDAEGIEALPPTAELIRIAEAESKKTVEALENLKGRASETAHHSEGERVAAEAIAKLDGYDSELLRARKKRLAELREHFRKGMYNPSFEHLVTQKRLVIAAAVAIGLYALFAEKKSTAASVLSYAGASLMGYMAIQEWKKDPLTEVGKEQGDMTGLATAVSAPDGSSGGRQRFDADAAIRAHREKEEKDLKNKESKEQAEIEDLVKTIEAAVAAKAKFDSRDTSAEVFDALVAGEAAIVRLRVLNPDHPLLVHTFLEEVIPEAVRDLQNEPALLADFLDYLVEGFIGFSTLSSTVALVMQGVKAIEDTTTRLRFVGILNHAESFEDLQEALRGVNAGRVARPSEAAARGGRFWGWAARRGHQAAVGTLGRSVDVLAEGEIAVQTQKVRRLRNGLRIAEKIKALKTEAQTATEARKVKIAARIAKLERSTHYLRGEVVVMLRGKLTRAERALAGMFAAFDKPADAVDGVRAFLQASGIKNAAVLAELGKGPKALQFAKLMSGLDGVVNFKEMTAVLKGMKSAEEAARMVQLLEAIHADEVLKTAMTHMKARGLQRGLLTALLTSGDEVSQMVARLKVIAPAAEEIAQTKGLKPYLATKWFESILKVADTGDDVFAFVAKTKNALRVASRLLVAVPVVTEVIFLGLIGMEISEQNRVLQTLTQDSRRANLVRERIGHLIEHGVVGLGVGVGFLMASNPITLAILGVVMAADLTLFSAAESSRIAEERLLRSSAEWARERPADELIHIWVAGMVGRTEGEVLSDRYGWLPGVVDSKATNERRVDKRNARYRIMEGILIQTLGVQERELSAVLGKQKLEDPVLDLKRRMFEARRDYLISAVPDYDAKDNITAHRLLREAEVYADLILQQERVVAERNRYAELKKTAEFNRLPLEIQLWWSRKDQEFEEDDELGIADDSGPFPPPSQDDVSVVVEAYSKENAPGSMGGHLPIDDFNVSGNIQEQVRGYVEEVASAEKKSERVAAWGRTTIDVMDGGAATYSDTFPGLAAVHPLDGNVFDEDLDRAAFEDRLDELANYLSRVPLGGTQNTEAEELMLAYRACSAYYEAQMGVAYTPKAVREQASASKIQNWVERLRRPESVEGEAALESMLAVRDDVLEQEGAAFSGPGHYVLYRLAGKLGYQGARSIHAVREFFSEDKANNHGGIYWNGEQWAVQIDGWFDKKFSGWMERKEENLRKEVSEAFVRKSRYTPNGAQVDGVISRHPEWSRRLRQYKDSVRRVANGEGFEHSPDVLEFLLMTISENRSGILTAEDDSWLVWDTPASYGAREKNVCRWGDLLLLYGPLGWAAYSAASLASNEDGTSSIDRPILERGETRHEASAQDREEDVVFGFEFMLGRLWREFNDDFDVKKNKALLSTALRENLGSEYQTLPHPVILFALRAGYENAGMFAYRLEGDKLYARQLAPLPNGKPPSFEGFVMEVEGREQFQAYEMEEFDSFKNSHHRFDAYGNQTIRFDEELKSAVKDHPHFEMLEETIISIGVDFVRLDSLLDNRVIEKNDFVLQVWENYHRRRGRYSSQIGQLILREPKDAEWESSLRNLAAEIHSFALAMSSAFLERLNENEGEIEGQADVVAIEADMASLDEGMTVLLQNDMDPNSWEYGESSFLFHLQGLPDSAPYLEHYRNYFFQEVRLARNVYTKSTGYCENYLGEDLLSHVREKILSYEDWFVRYHGYGPEDLERLDGTMDSLRSETERLERQRVVELVGEGVDLREFPDKTRFALFVLAKRYGYDGSSSIQNLLEFCGTKSDSVHGDHFASWAKHQHAYLYRLAREYDGGLPPPPFQVKLDHVHPSKEMRYCQQIDEVLQHQVKRGAEDPAAEATLREAGYDGFLFQDYQDALTARTPRQMKLSPLLPRFLISQLKENPYNYTSSDSRLVSAAEVYYTEEMKRVDKEWNTPSNVSGIPE